MSGHYEVTAAEARSVASALKKFASQLGSAQGDGRVALKNAIHWMGEVNTWQDKLAAEQAAGVAGLALEAVAISAPNTVGQAVNGFVNGVSGTSTATIFAGLRASGSSQANWQWLIEAGAGASVTATGSAKLTGVSGDVSGQAFAGEQGDLNGSLGWSQLGANGDANELAGVSANGDVNGEVGLSGVDAGASGSVSVDPSKVVSDINGAMPWNR